MNVFLTFDDGPNEPYTSQILDILKKFQAKASFFVCGKNIERFPETTKRIVNEGHGIGNHTYSHSKILAGSGFWGEEIEKTQNIIQKITGKTPFLFRPPWGILTPWLKNYLKSHNLKFVLWDIEAHDWLQPSFKIIAKRVLKKAKPNSIILLHDGEKTKHNSDRAQTVLALPIILRNLKTKGYDLESLEI